MSVAKIMGEKQVALVRRLIADMDNGIDVSEVPIVHCFGDNGHPILKGLSRAGRGIIDFRGQNTHTYKLSLTWGFKQLVSVIRQETDTTKRKC